MLLTRKNIVLIATSFFLLGSFLISCTKDDPKETTEEQMDPTDEDPIDDSPPDSAGLTGEIDWIQTYGGSGEDAAVAIIKTTDNNYVIAGSTRSNDGDLPSRPGSDQDYWVLKISATGGVIWSKTFGGTADDIATSIILTSDEGFLVSGYSRSNDGDVSGNAGFHDYWILKLDANGNKQWDKNFGFPGSDQAFDVLEKRNGGYFISGFFDVSASEGQGNDGRSSGSLHGVGEYWAINMDVNGNFIWRRFFGGSNNDRAYEALETLDGGFLLAGASESNDFDITDDKGSYDFWAVRLDGDGNKIWTKSYGGSEIDNGFSIAPTSDGNYLFVGDTRSSDQDVTNPLGNADLWIVKLNDSNGNLMWQKSLGGSQFESARSIRPIGNDRFLLAGATRSSDGDVASNNGENDAWAVIIDASGNLLFEKTIGGSNFDFANDAILDFDNTSIIMVGNTESNDKDIPLNRGIKDLLIVKIK